MRAESYVVRIYRRRSQSGQSVVGVVEAAWGGWQKPFQSLDELAEILARPHARSRHQGPRSDDRAAKRE
jgi:hypothetical protein